MKDNAKQSNPVDMNDAAEALTFSSAGLSGRQAQPGQEGPAGGGQEGERWMMRRAAGPSG